MLHQQVLVALTAVLVATTAAPTAYTEQSTKVPLLNRRAQQIRGTDGHADIPLLLGELHHILVKHGAQGLHEKYHPIIRSLSRRDNTVKLTDQTDDGEDSLYFGSGTVGSQDFTFDFDTGSSDLFVPGPDCGSGQGCPGTTKYNEQGTDLGNTTSIKYGSGEVSGENYLDSVTVGGLTAEKQNVISLTEAEGFSTSKSDGLLGLAFESIANSKQSPFFQTLVNQGKVSTPEFSFYLGRAQSNTQGDSELTLGGRDSSKYTGDVTEIPLTSATYWQIALDAVTIDGEAIDSTPGQAAIDTGTTLIIAPTDAADAIFAQIPGAGQIPLEGGTSSTTLYAYPCDFNGTVAIQFAGKQFEINALDLNFGSATAGIGLQEIELADGGLLGGLDGLLGGLLGGGSSGGGGSPAIGEDTCIAGIAGADIRPADHLYVVGDTFLKNWYSIYSFEGADGNPSVSFAAAVGNQ